MKRRLPLVLVLVAALTLVFSAVANATLSTSYVFNGHGGYSADGLGQNGPGGVLRAEVPAGSTVQKAFLYGTHYFVTDPDLTQRTIDFDGTMVVTTKIGDVNSLATTRADVTAQVAAKVGGGGGITTFTIGNDPSALNGLGLVVVYANAAQPENTIAVLDGAASQAGDTATFVLAAPLDKTVPGFQATMSLGSGHSYQGVAGHVCAPSQFSIVDVNSQRLTSCAGNFDDGLGNDGALVTVGGVGDLTDNPVDPNNQTGVDDELYNLSPFLAQGVTSIEVKTSNPSQDDDLFLAVISISARATVTNEDCNDGIDNDGDGLIDAADPDCAPPPTGNTCGNIQGNGVPRENARARFEFGIRYKTGDPSPTGSLSFNDKATPMVFDSTSISTLVINGDDATATGSGIANGLPVTFTLTIHNHPDSFSIQLSNGYSATWTPKSGRIEIHDKC